MAHCYCGFRGLNSWLIQLCRSSLHVEHLGHYASTNVSGIHVSRRAPCIAVGKLIRGNLASSNQLFFVYILIPCFQSTDFVQWRCTQKCFTQTVFWCGYGQTVRIMKSQPEGCAFESSRRADLLVFMDRKTSVLDYWSRAPDKLKALFSYAVLLIRSFDLWSQWYPLW